MRRATVTIPDNLEAELDRYLESQRPTPSLTAILQTALERFLHEQRFQARGYMPPRGPLRVTPAPHRAEAGPDTATDVSIEHDRHLAEAVSPHPEKRPEPVES